MFQSKKNIIAGRNPVTEALKSGQTIDKILMYKNASGDVIQEIRKLAKDLNIPVQYVPNEKLNGLTNVQHQGVVAYKTSVVYQDLQQVIDHTNDKGETILFVMLDGVTDVRNIGAIARSAVCCGAQAIIIPDKGVGALNEDAVKSSAGAMERINICRVNSLLKAVDTLHLNGVKVFTSEMKAGIKLHELGLTEPCCIIMGNEEKGVQQYMSKAADAHFTIPMKEGFDSLNVSVATGIILYEALKQRMLKA
ncbi:23S rRNA (guanosine(2251)-2'-O)-methyltransferase RlmB [Panacibacter sp. DH6]|uniref:23S rRNA (Guanosine(2251)-2'-O)-methyltransferase RlmB n=1 Tax=Panacibacter microcysteis TaxID=2793269 RepID=A0A931H004_9BACT|nr:23S rRNA (guanosine(2251)-2'-O)-methyltransferase RlmB [Panacibacter microcysteis]MBG9378506.1 23S rRNA (guanosine(2251)-2'-O)-methyltransferase RlmB [Panacibacter microcysteis]